MHTPNIQHFLQSYRAAVLQKDLKAFCRLYSDDVHIFDAWGGPWHMQGIEALRTSTQQWFDSLGDERVQVTESGVHSRSDENLAMAHGIWRFAAISEAGAELRWLENRFSIALRHDSGMWRVFHQHTSSPADFTNGKAQLRRPEQSS